MKIAQFIQAGTPEEVLEIKEISLLEPKAGELRVRVKASPINPSDTMFVRGLYGIRPQLPSGAGFEGVGIVDAVGEGVDIPVGTRVMFTTIGAWAEYAIVSAKTASPVPAHIPDEVAAQSFVNPLTAWAMIHESGVKAGGWLLLTAGGSTFSQLVIQMAKSKGINTIATVRRNDQDEQLKALGVTAIVNTEDSKWVKQVFELTGGQGADCCLEAVGGATATQALKCLKNNGKMLIYGLLSLQNPTVDSGLMIFKNLTIKGFWLTAWLAEADKNVKQELFKEVYSLLGTDALKVTIEARYSLDKIKEAVAHADKPGRNGKVLVVID
ncbi:MAG: alcohol dehydrogenase [Cytophagales bacterium]|nr:MAG: alcohol dehydrogenase [Cytophagales bacterium]